MSILLDAGTKPLPQAPTLNLLPFSLSPTPPSAPISTYFRPRTAPATHPAAGRQVAAFRGRQVVAQEIPVPRGYRGVVLRAGGFDLGKAAAVKVEPQVATRTRGAGQVALSRPRTRRVVQKRKFVLNDDEEEEGPLRQRPMTEAEPATPEPVPSIRVVAATPNEHRGGVGGVESVASVASVASVTSVTSVTSVATSVDLVETVLPEETRSLTTTPSVISLAETETGDADPTSTSPDDSLAAVSALTHTPTASRVLTPTHQFSSFTLWTPDTHLAGFDADEVVPDEGWRRGGAGDGGDEFVRALGEWTAVCQLVSGGLLF